MKKLFLLNVMALAIICLQPTQSFAQKQKGQKKGAKTEQSTTQKDSTANISSTKKLSTIEKFIKPSAIKMEGMTPIYKQDGKFYLKINDSLLGRDIRMVSRVYKSAEGVRGSFAGYAGDQINEGLFRFEKGPNDKIFIKNVDYRERSKEIMPENVENSNFPAIVAAFDIKAQSTDKKESIIELSDFLLSDSEYIFFTKRDKAGFKLGGMQKDKSYIENIKTFPINTEFKVVYTYARQEGNPTATFGLNCSFVLLPKVPMVARYEDPRVGYFTVRYTDFDKNPQRVETTRLITRWRLEPKPEDIEKYNRGELVEPAKPIIFYIDPATPKQWVPYLIAGVNDWQKVFEKAGFKNAIYAKEAPTFEQDSTWSLEDARHSAIVYKPSDIPNASGPHVNDPRSGEIIESHVNWYHNVMLLLRNWYFIQCSPVDPAARKMTFDTELMGQLVRFVSSHEVGHTLGLRHNFRGTALYTTAQLRDPKFLRENGHTTSIMDYSRFNYVAQPEDNIPQECLFPRLGAYDDWVIEWGYRRFNNYNDPKKELAMINKWIIEKTKDPKYLFGTESSANDPRFQSEDLGANQMEANQLGIKNLKVVMNNLITWTSEPNGNYDNLKTLYSEILGQYVRYMNHVAKWIGGVYQEEKKVEQEGAVYTPVEKSKQKEALAFLKKNFFDPQLWLVPNDVLNKTVLRADLSIGTTYDRVLPNLLSKRVMLNLYQDELINGTKAYTMEEYFKDLNAIIFSPILPDKSKAIFQRLLQKSYVENLIALYTGENGPRYKKGDENKDASDIISTTYAQLKDLQKKFNLLAASSTGTNKAHYMFLADKINNKLKVN